MKALYFILSALLLFSFSTPSLSAKAEEANLYAEIIDDTFLFSKSDEAYTPVCTLPKSYFVQVIGEKQNGYYEVNYDDLNGFVLSSAVSFCESEPTSKYHSSPLVLFNDGHAVSVRSSPKHDEENLVASLPSFSAVDYYGTVEGSTQVEAVGNKWYYIRFDHGGEKKRGYVYSLYADEVEIPENQTDWLPVVTEPVSPPKTDEPETNESDAIENTATPLSPLREGIIIAALCIPAVLIIYILFKSGNRKKG
jgi:uncharacterized protein YgiM (DUF1202 family)